MISWETGCISVTDFSLPEIYHCLQACPTPMSLAYVLQLTECYFFLQSSAILYEGYCLFVNHILKLQHLNIRGNVRRKDACSNLVLVVLGCFSGAPVIRIWFGLSFFADLLFAMVFLDKRSVILPLTKK